MLIVDETSKTPIYLQLYKQIREDIMNGTLTPGTKLNSSRALSAELRISRNTVDLAYGKLYAEGFLLSKPRLGYFVELPLIEGTGQKEVCTESGETLIQNKKYNIIHDLSSKKLNQDEFPFQKWKALSNKCINYYKHGMLEYVCPFGEPGLRSEIQRFIYHYRQVKCLAKQIIIGPGTQFCLELICPYLVRSGGKIAIEDPGYHKTKATLRNNGVQICPIPLDEQGIDVRLLSSTESAAAYVTPSHQYPTGIVMSKKRRRELAEWAKQTHSFIIEDDYNGCFQYDLKPISSIQSLCPDNVIYIGSFSELLFPSIGVSYMVLPNALLEELCASHCHNAIYVPFLTQKTLELFMREGFLESHVRKMVKLQRDKRNLLMSSIRNEFGDKVLILGEHAGFHLFLHIQWETDEETLIRKARSIGIALQSTTEFWNDSFTPRGTHILMNYGGMQLEDIPEVIKQLKAAWA